MARPSDLRSFVPSSPRGGSPEEIQVGAYARRQRRRRFLVGVVGALLIAGALLLYLQLRPHAEANDVERYPVRVRCVSCGYTAARHVRPAQTFPMECPQCGEMSCQQLWQCRDCGARFVPEQTGGVRRCPACNSERVGSAAVR